MLFASKSILLGTVFLTCSLCASVNFDVFDPDTLSVNAGATNEVRRFGIIRLTKDDVNYTLEIDAGIRSDAAEAVIVDNNLADIDITPKLIVKTIAQVDAAKKIEGDFILEALPNPLSIGGYQVYLQILDIQINFASLSNLFLRFQTPAASNDQSQLVYLSILNGTTSANSWFTVSSSTLLADAWTSDRLIQIDDSFGSTTKTKKTFKISIPVSEIVATLPEDITEIPNGVYEFRITMGMEPFVKLTLTEQIEIYNSIAASQTLFFNNLLTDMDAILDNQNNLRSLTTTEQATLKTNRNTLKAACKVFLEAEKKQYQAFAVDPDATEAQQEEINAIVVVIDAEIVALDALN